MFENVQIDTKTTQISELYKNICQKDTFVGPKWPPSCKMAAKLADIFI